MKEAREIIGNFIEWTADGSHFGMVYDQENLELREGEELIRARAFLARHTDTEGKS